ncbi:hypothetical protein [Sulfuritalea sp.]|uniref:hypothetical protein n=1 Tax=Sulfuritalea sp. TaxID=2480090 RepID=UPI00286D81FD|nr:hypothetical protein [Sulfuritalea sp.]
MEPDLTCCTLDEIHAFIKKDAAQRDVIWQEKYDHIVRAKNASWLLLLVVVFLQVYLINVMIEATKLETRTLVNTASTKPIGCRPYLTQL